MNRILAIDPGKSGGFAYHGIDGIPHCFPMPETEGDVLVNLLSLKASGVSTAVIEQVVGFIPKSGAGAMFTFGEGYGFLKGCLMALGYRVELVRPAKWQAALSLGSKSSHGKQWKNHLKATAQRLFPHCDVTLKTADALLIFEYASNKTEPGGNDLPVHITMQVVPSTLEEAMKPIVKTGGDAK